MTVAARIALASPDHGTMLAFLPYTLGREGFIPLAVWSRAALPGKS
jgi:hypothetical protein